MIDESDATGYEPSTVCGVHFLMSGHWGPFKLSRILSNEATRYGTLDMIISVDGDTRNTDTIVHADGAYGDMNVMPPAGEADDEVCSSAECICEVMTCVTGVAVLGWLSNATGCATESHVKCPGHGAACDPIGYGTGMLPYSGSTALYHDDFLSDATTELGTMPITELTSISGMHYHDTRDDGRIAAMKDCSPIV